MYLSKFDIVFQLSQFYVIFSMYLSQFDNVFLTFTILSNLQYVSVPNPKSEHFDWLLLESLCSAAWCIKVQHTVKYRPFELISFPSPLGPTQWKLDGVGPIDNRPSTIHPKSTHYPFGRGGAVKIFSQIIIERIK